ncbi:MAG: TonB-dependent receptor [Candidatus Kapaibacteriales bacterium]
MLQNYLLRIISLFSIIFFNIQLFSADFKGRLVDTDDGSVIAFANVGILRVSDSLLIGSAVSDDKGIFSISLENKTGRGLLAVRAAGYQSPELPIDNLSLSKDFGTLKLEKIDADSEEILVEAEAQRGKMAGDTLKFNAAAFKTNPDADAEDLVKKMAGISDDGTGLKAQGEEVKRVMVDGKEFFGNDVQATLKNIPAEAVKTVGVYDRASDNAEFTGVSDGEEEKTINLELKEEYKSGAFGSVRAGYGTEDRYSAGTAVNYFSGPTRLSLLGNLNNVNQVNFTQDELAGVSQSTINGGGGRRRYQYSNASEFYTGQNNGITSTAAVGLNYVDEWYDGGEVSAAYFLSGNENDVETFSDTEFIGAGVDGDRILNSSNGGSERLGHRLSARMKFELDSMKEFLIIPRLNITDNSSISDQDALFNPNESIITQFTGNESDAESFDIDFTSNFFYRQKFAKKGRTIQIDGQVEANNNDRVTEFQNSFGLNANEISSLQLQRQDFLSKSNNLELEIDYTEPLFGIDDLLLVAELNGGVERQTVEQLTFDETENRFLVNNLSSDLEVDYQRMGSELGFRYGDDEFVISAVGEYRRADMQSGFTLPITNEVNRTFEALASRVFMMIREKGHSFRLFLRRRNTLPSARQLNDAINNTNPLSISQGNSGLDQEMQNYLWMSYNLFDIETDVNIFASANGNITNNTIGSVTQIFSRDTVLSNGVNAGAGSQFFTNNNLGNTYRLNLNTGLGHKLGLISSNINYSFNYNYNQTPSVINGINNRNTIQSIGPSVSLSSNISENVDFSFSYSPDYNIVDNTIPNIQNNDYWRHTAGLNFNFILPYDFVIRGDVSHTSLVGLGEGFDQNFNIISGGVGYRFLENNAAEISLNIFDALNQNQAVFRNIDQAQIIDTRTNALTQYFLLSFNYRIRNTAGSGKSRPPFSRRR